ncbi:MAG: PAS-domain containing protein [Rhizobiaceae bacterium]
MDHDDSLALDLLRDAIQSLTEGFALYDKDHCLVMFNERYKEMNGLVADILEPGLNYETMLRQMVRRGGYADAAGNEDAWVAERVENAVVYAKGDTVHHSNGKSYQVSIHPTKLGGFVVTRTDITDQKRSEDEGLRIRDVLQDAIESLSEGFALYDDDRRLVLCNQRYKEMNAAVADLLKPGLDWEILMRETARRGVYVDAIGREDQWVRDRLETTDDYVDEFELHQTDGSHYLVSTHPTKLGGFVVTRTDTTKRKKAELAERDGDFLIRTVLDASPAIVIMARTGDGEILYRSPAALEMFGRTRSAKEHYVEPDQRADFVTQMLADGQVDDYQISVKAKGKILPATMSGRFAEYRGEEVIVTSVIDLTEQVKENELIKFVLEACPTAVRMSVAETGQILFSSPETIAMLGDVKNAKSSYADQVERKKQLNEMRARGGSIKDKKALLYDAKGDEFWGAISARMINFKDQEIIVSNTRDLTDELALQGELATQREMLFQNEKMSALGELLAGVAHELNNPLSIVVGHSLMLKEEVLDPDLLKRIDKISAAAERSAKIVKTFLAMARQQPTRMEPVDLKSIIATSVDVAGYGKAQEGLEIISSIPDGLPEISADADQITQVIINLIMNGHHAISTSAKGDKIEVSAREGRRQGTIKIVVKDNGPGIDENIRARIFEPFFTTKDVGDGTGIGLAFCHRIIHSHGGKIWLDQEYTNGSKFCITLPIAVSSSHDIDSRLPNRAGDAKRILVVDDEVDVGEFIVDVLRKEKFEVDYASSGHQAFHLLETKVYDAVLSDLNMPGVDGRILFDRICADFNDLVPRIAFITGDTMGTTSQKLLQSSQRPYLEKPVSPNELRKLVYDLLNDAKEDE